MKRVINKKLPQHLRGESILAAGNILPLFFLSSEIQHIKNDKNLFLIHSKSSKEKSKQKQRQEAKK
ncbi:hypothetical protein LI294_20975 [bacterium 210702-DFI.5.13]|nr:hypothetical protein [bacterium 210702-DFI.5.13]